MGDILFVTWDGGGNLPPSHWYCRRAATPRRSRADARTRAAAQHHRTGGTAVRAVLTSVHVFHDYARAVAPLD